MARMWQKSAQLSLDPVVEAFCVGQDYLLDGRLFRYELWASLAHARMLETIGILNDSELTAVKKEIQALYKKYGGTITMSVSDEDIHSRLEALLIEAIGDTGKKIHTGRSRNDQVQVVTRLYMKDSLLRIAEIYKEYLNNLCSFLERENGRILPGYTHTKQAMLMTAGFWAAGFIESGLDNLRVIENTLSIIDCNPLGSGSGFGVPVPLDRSMTSELLGFSRVQQSPQYVQNSRGKFEGQVIDSLWNIMNDYSRMAADLLLFNMDELLFIETDAAVTTGSSIMPQKRNLDVMELMRARASVMQSYSSTVKTISSGILSGYNRDVQETKEPLVRALDLAEQSIAAVNVVLEHISFNDEAVRKALSGGIFATDVAFKAVAEGMPFRDAYRKAAESIDTIKVNETTIQNSIKERVSPGSPATVDPSAYRKLVSEAGASAAAARERMNAAFSKTMEI